MTLPFPFTKFGRLVSIFIGESTKSYNEKRNLKKSTRSIEIMTYPMVAVARNAERGRKRLTLLIFDDESQRDEVVVRRIIMFVTQGIN